jgi:hypothetical protein
MKTGLFNISGIISICESHWEEQIEEIGAIIKKLEESEQRIIKPHTRNILVKARQTRTSAKNYSFNMRQALNRDKILVVRIS